MRKKRRSDQDRRYREELFPLCRVVAVIAIVALLLAILFLQSVKADDTARYFTRDRGKSALTHPVADLGEEASDQFALGRSFFHIPWVEAPAATTARDGLGPLFNANSCVSCHRNNGGGVALVEGDVDRSVIIRLAHGGRADKTAMHPDPVYGAQISINGNRDVPFEGRVTVSLEDRQVAYADGSPVLLKQPEFALSDLNYGALSGNTALVPLRAPALIGLGLIESIPQQQIDQYADEHDANGDGISGRVNRVWSVQHQQYTTGRYGWKATSPSVIEQSADALISDMGLTSPWYTRENCSKKQSACLAAYKSPEPDVPMQRLLAINDYLLQTRVPRPRIDPPEGGRQLFEATGCAACHRSGYVNEDGVKVDPYSDFLLHDMGPGLAANSGMFSASPAEWRTAPLWGVGLAKTLNPHAGFLHDGRASTLEQAILWHGGEADQSRRAFASLSATERDILLAFLKSL